MRNTRVTRYWHSAFILLTFFPLFATTFAAASEAVEITFWTMENPKGTLSKEIEIFEKENPDIKIHLVGLNYDIGFAALHQAALSKKGPDVFQLGSTWLPLFQKFGMLTDTTDWINQMGGERVFIPEALRNVGMEGSNRLFGVPWGYDFRFLSYRKDALKIRGVTESDIATLGGFAAACTKVDGFTDSNGVRHHAVGWGLPGHIFYMTAWSRGTDLVDTASPAGLWDENSMQQGLKQWLILLGNYGTHWGDGEPIFSYIGPWELSTMKDVENVGIAPIPAGAGGAFTFSGGSVLCISSSSKNVPASKKLIEFLISPESQRRFCMFSILPVRRDVLNEFLEKNSAYRELGKHLKKGEGYFRTPVRVPATAYVDTIFARKNGLASQALQGYFGPYDPNQVSHLILQRAREECNMAIHKLEAVHP